MLTEQHRDFGLNEAKGVFGGYNFAVTGNFKEITRQNLEKFITKNGG